jgi:hypothetical protein
MTLQAIIDRLDEIESARRMKEDWNVRFADAYVEWAREQLRLLKLDLETAMRREQEQRHDEARHAAR